MNHSQKQSYFAFISYNRKNSAVAEFIQNALEHYRYPKESIAEELWPEDDQYVRKIFLDKSHLSGRGREFEAQIEEALANSRYLIVVCSPEAAEIKDGVSKHYVNWEIETFLKFHGEDALSRVIPVISKGEPDLSGNSCLPLPIRLPSIVKRNLPDMRPTGRKKETLWNRKQARFQAVITLLTYTFDVERSIIHDRFQAERARQRAKNIIITSAVLVFLTLLTAWFVLERHRAWVETEKNKAKLQVSENQKQDAIARISYNEALKIIQSKNENINRPLALLYLANSWRLPEAQRRASLLLQQNSWLLPVETSAGKNQPMKKIKPFSIHSERVIPQNIPQKFPVSYQFKRDVLQAKLNSNNKILWHTNNQWGIHSLNVSPDGRFLILLKVLPSFAAEAYDPFTGKLLWRKELDNRPMTSAFSPDGLRFAVLLQNSFVEVLQNETGKTEFERCKFPAHTWKIEFTEDSSNIRAYSPQQCVKYTLLQHSIDIPVLLDWQHPLSSYCMSPSKKMLILAGSTSINSNTVLLCKAETLSKINTFKVEGHAHTMAVSEDEKLLAILYDQTLAVYDISATGNIKLLSRHAFKYLPDHLLFDKESKNCYIAGGANEVWRWNRDLKTCTKTAISDPDTIMAIAWSKQGELITCGRNLMFWDADNAKLLKSFPLKQYFKKVTVTDDYIVCGSSLSRMVAVYNHKGQKLWQTTPYADPGVIPFAISDDAKLIAIADSRTSVACFELATGTPVREKIIADSWITTLKFRRHSKDQTHYLCIGGGDTRKGFYIVYDIAGRDIVYQTKTGNSSIDCFFALNNDLLFASGKGNSTHSVFELPAIKKFNIQPFRAFFENYTGARINKYGVNQIKTDTSFDAGRTAEIFPQAMIPAPDRMITRGLRISDAAARISEQNYYATSRALYLSPNNPVAMNNFWMQTARSIATKNHHLFHPEKTAEQRDRERAVFSAEDWAVFIFSDPQAVFFADYFTKLMVKRHPGNKKAEEARNDFLRLSGKSSGDQKAFEKMKLKIKKSWEQMVKTPGKTTLEQIQEIAIYQLLWNCSSLDDVRKYLDQSAGLLTKNSNMNALNFKHTMIISNLISKICAMVRYIPDGHRSTVEFLQKTIAGMKNAKPEHTVNELLFTLHVSMAETCFLAGDLKTGERALQNANKYSQSSYTAMFTLPYLQVLQSTVAGKSAHAVTTWNEFLNQLKSQPAVAAAVSKKLWSSLEIMKQKGIEPGKMEKVRQAYKKRFNTGTAIKIVQGRTAEKMGWKNNDKILEFAGFPVTSQEDLAGILFALDISSTVPETVTVKLRQKNGIKSYRVKTKQKLGFTY